jgi:hypothetical protein
MKVLRHRRYEDRYALVIELGRFRVGDEDGPAAASLLTLEWPVNPTVDPETGEPSMTRDEWEDMQLREAKALATMKAAELERANHQVQGSPLRSEGQEL